MAYWIIAAGVAVIVRVSYPPSCDAVTLTGIVLYATDDFGNPSNWNEAAQDFGIHFVWRTTRTHGWFGLAVLWGLPPESLAGSPLNTENFEIAIPLTDGENDFTIVGSGKDEAPDRFSLNLFFDDNRNQPDISVLVLGRAGPYGEAVTQHRSDRVFTFALEEVRPPFTPPMLYDDGLQQVSVAAASFRPPDSPWSVDVVGGQVLRPDGANDLMGVLRLMVDPSMGTNTDAPAPRALPVGGGIGGNVAPVPAPSAPDLRGQNAAPRVVGAPPLAPGRVEGEELDATDSPAVVEPAPEPTCNPAQPGSCGTPGPTISPSVLSQQTTPSPGISPTRTTPTAGASPSPQPTAAPTGDGTITMVYPSPRRTPPPAAVATFPGSDPKHDMAPASGLKAASNPPASPLRITPRTADVGATERTPATRTE